MSKKKKNNPIVSNKNSAGKKKIMEFPERGARVRGEEKVEERGPRYSRGLAGQVSRGARSAADHFDPRPHQSSPNHTPLISTRRGTKAVHVLHVMHVTARAHAPLSFSLSPWFARHPASAAFSSYAHSNPPLIIPSPPLHFDTPLITRARYRVTGQSLVTVARIIGFEIDVWEYRSDN